MGKGVPTEAGGERGERGPEYGVSQAGVLCVHSPECDRGRGHQRLQAGLPEAELQTDPQAPQAAPGMPGRRRGRGREEGGSLE